jgi:hypothetical protein
VIRVDCRLPGIFERNNYYSGEYLAAHLAARDVYSLFQLLYMLVAVGVCLVCLALDVEKEDAAALRNHVRIGLPLDRNDFLGRLEVQLDREHRP